MRIAIIRFLEIIWVIFLTTFIFVSVLFALWHRAAYHGERLPFPLFYGNKSLPGAPAGIMNHWRLLKPTKNDISCLRHFLMSTSKVTRDDPLLWSLTKTNVPLQFA